MIRCLLVCAALADAALVGATAASAAQRDRSRSPLVEQHRAVGAVLPIVAGSSTIKVDSVGQVVTNFQPGNLNDNGRATGGTN